MPGVTSFSTSYVNPWRTIQSLPTGSSRRRLNLPVCEYNRPWDLPEGAMDETNLCSYSGAHSLHDSYVTHTDLS